MKSLLKHYLLVLNGNTFTLTNLLEEDLKGAYHLAPQQCLDFSPYFTRSRSTIRPFLFPLPQKVLMWPFLPHHLVTSLEGEKEIILESLRMFCTQQAVTICPKKTIFVPYIFWDILMRSGGVGRIFGVKKLFFLIGKTVIDTYCTNL